MTGPSDLPPQSTDGTAQGPANDERCRGRPPIDCWLFLQEPEAFPEMAAVPNHFREHGLTLEDYAVAVERRPTLYTVESATVIANIEAVVQHFRKHGLTLHDYLRAAVTEPLLFTHSPATIQENLKAVVQHFQDQGLTLHDYLRAAVMRPALFIQSPATVIGHVNLLSGLYRQGLVSFPGQAAATLGQPLRPLFAFLVRHPQYFTMAADNLVLREIAARITGNGHTGATLLNRERHRVERELAAALGHADLQVPVSKEPASEDGGDPDRHARNLLLRALVRTGLIKGTLAR